MCLSPTKKLTPTQNLIWGNRLMRTTMLFGDLAGSLIETVRSFFCQSIHFILTLACIHPSTSGDQHFLSDRFQIACHANSLRETPTNHKGRMI